MGTVDFYFSIGSRYSYLASTRIASLERETGCEVEWHPLNSAALFRRRGRSPFKGKPVSGQYDWTYRELDAKRWAAFYGVPYVEPRGRVDFDPKTLALAATVAKRLGEVVTYSHHLFAAMFVVPVARIDAAECIRRAGECGIPAAQFRSELESPETLKDLNHTLKNALAAGVFGVPSFIVDGELFFGNDRLVLLRDRLRPGTSR